MKTTYQVSRLFIKLFLLFLFSGGAYAHTNSIGFVVSSSASSNANVFDVEAFFGSWHTNPPANGRAILYSLKSGGNVNTAADYDVVAYGDNNETTGNNEYVYSRTPNAASGINFTTEGIAYDVAKITTAGFTPGTNYFWVNQSSGALMSTNVGAYKSVYAHQSATITDVAPGTYRLDYELPKPTVMDWTPVVGVDNVIFTVSSNGVIVVAGAPAAVNVSGDMNTDISMSHSDFSNAFSGTLTDIKIDTLPSNGDIFIDSNSNGSIDSGETVISTQVLTITNQNLLKYKPNNNYSGSDVFRWYGWDTAASTAAYSTSSANVNITINDVGSPVFTSLATASVVESPNLQVLAITLAATDVNAITYSISGGDSALFTVDSSSGAVSFIAAINHSAPHDGDTNNIYTFTATATDASGNTTTQAVAITVTLLNNIAPTMTITASGASSVADGSTSEDSTLTITFTSNEVTTDFALGDITVTNATLSNFNATSSTVYTATLTPAAQGAVTVNVAAGTFNDAAGNDNTAASEFNWTYLSNPLNKKDVVGSVEAWTNTSSRWAKHSIDVVDGRILWLNRHKDTTRTSHQGIKIHFENEVIEAVMNTTPRSKVSIVSNVKNSLFTLVLLQDTDNAMVASGNNIKSDTQDIALNEAARFRKDTIGTLNPTFGTVIDDWSIWTAGEIAIGKSDATSSASKQELNSRAVSLGFDKPVGSNDLTGFVLSIGKDDTDVGTSTTEVKSDNYSLSNYNILKQENGMVIETVLGLGHLKFDTTRKDGNDTLTGSRNANQAFASVTVRDDAFERNNWSISPYGKATLARTNLNSFSEAGGATALTYNKQTVNDAMVSVGADMNYLVTIQNGTIKPFAKLEYGLDISDSSEAVMRYNSETTLYTLNIDDKSKSSWKLGLGVDLITKGSLGASINYKREQAVNAGYSDSLTVKVELQF